MIELRSSAFLAMFLLSGPGSVLLSHLNCTPKALYKDMAGAGYLQNGGMLTSRGESGDCQPVSLQE